MSDGNRATTETWHVYALCEPADGRIRYVGKGANPARRLASHLSPSGSPRVRAWAASLKEKPTLRVLASVGSETEALLLEQGWIAKIRAADPTLLNVSDGGQRGRVPSAARFSGFGTRVVSMRKARGWSQRRLVSESGIPQPTISQIEAERRTNVPASIAVILARTLGTTVEWLVTGEQPAFASGAP